MVVGRGGCECGGGDVGKDEGSVGEEGGEGEDGVVEVVAAIVISDIELLQ